MTRETILEAITQEVHRAVPGILELKEGCLMNVWWLKHFADIISGAEPDEVVSFTERTMKNNGHVQGKYWAIIEDNVMGVVEILGRPITLADILIAIRKKDEVKTSKDYGGSFPPIWAVNSFGVFCQLQYPGTKAERIYFSDAHWIMEKSLHDQPLPTLQFLYDLLVDKE